MSGKLSRMDYRQICLEKYKGLVKAFYCIFAFDNTLNGVEVHFLSLS